MTIRSCKVPSLHNAAMDEHKACENQWMDTALSPHITTCLISFWTFKSITVISNQLQSYPIITNHDCSTYSLKIIHTHWLLFWWCCFTPLSNQTHNKHNAWTIVSNWTLKMKRHHLTLKFFDISPGADRIQAASTSTHHIPYVSIKKMILLLWTLRSRFALKRGYWWQMWFLTSQFDMRLHSSEVCCHGYEASYLASDQCNPAPSTRSIINLNIKTCLLLSRLRMTWSYEECPNEHIDEKWW